MYGPILSSANADRRMIGAGLVKYYKIDENKAYRKGTGMITTTPIKITGTGKWVNSGVAFGLRVD